MRDDPYWQLVKRHLNTAAHVGIHLEQPLQDALNQGPLPNEHPAAALWYRLLPVLPQQHDTTIGGRRHSAAWVNTLQQAISHPVAGEVPNSPGWAEVVESIETATQRGVDAGELLESAAGLIDLDHAHTDADVAAAILAARMRDLLDPPPAEHIDAEPPAAEHEILFEQLSTQRPGVAMPPQNAALEPPHPTVPSVSDAEENRDFGQTPTTRIVQLHEAAAAFYRQHYTDSSAAAYMRRRFGTDLSDQPLLVVGYAPRGPHTLIDHLQAAGASPDELVDAGLAKHNRRGQLIDVFRDRLVIGLHDHHGQLVGFTGRCAPDAGPNTPKYLNTPATRAFSKGQLLFGLHEAHDAIANGAEIVRTEGCMDALAITLAGQGKAVGVAPLGTALTANQAALLASQARRVWEATDSDPAGQAAAAKDYQRFTHAGIHARQLLLVSPTDDDTTPKDPAELYARPGGTEQIRAAIELGDSAPTLAARLLSDLVREASDQLATGDANTIVATARRAAKIIAPLPPNDWNEHIDVTADLLADHQPATSAEDRAWLRELVTAETHRAGEQWAPPVVADPHAATQQRTTEPPADQQHQVNQETLNRAKALLDRLTRDRADESAAAPTEPDPGTSRTRPGPGLER